MMMVWVAKLVPLAMARGNAANANPLARLRAQGVKMNFGEKAGFLMFLSGLVFMAARTINSESVPADMKAISLIFMFSIGGFLFLVSGKKAG